MNEKVYIEGYIVGSFADTLGMKGKQIQVASMDIVNIDEDFIYKSIEPEKVKVLQFVADWYEEHKDNLEFYIFDYVYRFEQQNESDFKDWFDEFKTESFQTLVNMHQFGYEIEDAGFGEVFNSPLFEVEEVE